MGPDPGDELVLARAFQENRILITMDADYGVLAVLEQKPHAGIVRLLVDDPRQQTVVSLHVLSHFGNDLIAGALVTAAVDKVRIRKMGQGEG